MSVYVKDKPVGIDIVINDLQIAFDTELNWTNYEAYNRIYKNESIGGVIPEFFKNQVQGVKGEYIEVLLNDNFDASSFFYLSDTISTVDGGQLFTGILSVIFQVNVPKILGEQDIRNDEEIHRLVVLAINNSKQGKVNAIITSIPDVYTDFDISKLEWDDIQPYHCFRVDIDVSYAYDCKVNSKSPGTGNNIIII